MTCAKLAGRRARKKKYILSGQSILVKWAGQIRAGRMDRSNIRAGQTHRAVAAARHVAEDPVERQPAAARRVPCWSKGPVQHGGPTRWSITVVKHGGQHGGRSGRTDKDWRARFVWKQIVAGLGRASPLVQWTVCVEAVAGRFVLKRWPDSLCGSGGRTRPAQPLAAPLQASKRRIADTPARRGVVRKHDRRYVEWSILCIVVCSME